MTTALPLARAASLAYAILTTYKVWAPPGALTAPPAPSDQAQTTSSSSLRKEKNSRLSGSSSSSSSGWEGKLSSRAWKVMFALGFVTQTAIDVVVFQRYGGGWTTFSKEPFSLMDVLALAAMGAAWKLRQSSYKALGRFFTYKVHVGKDHELITDGPYSVLMHPGYAALVLHIVPFLYFIGLKNDLRILALYTLTGAIPLSRRIVNEEKDLQAHFGSTVFQEYRQSRWRVIPYVL